MIRKILSKDIPQAANIHFNALADDFLPSLGENFLQQLYQACLNSHRVIIYVFEKEGKIEGLIMGTADFTKFFTTILINNGFRLLWAAAPKILQKPQLLVNLLKTFIYPAKEKNKTKAELVVITVNPKSQRLGIGTGLINTLEKEFKERNIFQYKVCTLQERNEANQFYKKIGFSLHSIFVLYNKNWNLYIKNL